MRQTTLAVSIAFLVVSIAVAQAQLGPKDGGNLKPTDLERVNVGETAPDFTLENLDGNRISLSDFRGKKNVILVFYRGHW
jgi:cytochrome oxidase Cu insertion factor (SCO1/SenC/PrrC family)